MKNKLDIVCDWLPRYTGQPLEAFGDYILLTNFIGYLETFCALTGAAIVDGQRPHHDQLRHGQPQCRDGDGSAVGSYAEIGAVPRQVRWTEEEKPARRPDPADRRDPRRRYQRRLPAAQGAGAARVPV